MSLRKVIDMMLPFFADHLCVLCCQMPGVNLPMGQVGYYLLTLLICGVLHEVGHAIAAIRLVGATQMELSILKDLESAICMFIVSFSVDKFIILK